MPRNGAERGLGGVLIEGWSVETGTGGQGRETESVTGRSRNRSGSTRTT